MVWIGSAAAIKMIRSVMIKGLEAMVIESLTAARRYGVEDAVLDSLLPVYIESRIFNAMLQSAASEHAARQKAMKAASDNADSLIRDFTRLANNARQAEITQQIAEIVGGADALSSGK